MNHIYKIFAGFILAAVCLMAFQNCGETINYDDYTGSSSGSSVSGVPANITSLQPSYSKTVGDDLIITADVQGTDVSLKWYKNGNPLPNTTSTLTINNIQLSDAGDYMLKATTANPPSSMERTTSVSVSAAPTATPTPTPVNLPAAPQVTSQPSSVTMAYFSTNPTLFYQYENGVFVLDANNQVINDVTMAVTATGTGLKYQWQRKAVGQNSYQIISGATSRVYKFTMNSLTQAGQYRVQVTDAYNRSVTSNAGTVSTFEYVININYPYYAY